MRLAPLYDIASILPYDDIDPRKAKLAMKIGGKYELDEIRLQQWRKFATDVKIDDSALINGLKRMCSAIPDLLSAEVEKFKPAGIDHPLISKLFARISERALTILKLQG